MDDSFNQKNRAGFDRRLNQLDAYIEQRSGFEQRDIVRHRQVFIEKLKKTKQFHAMSEDQLYKMLLIASRVDIDEGDVLIRVGEESECMYILTDGKLRVELGSDLLGVITPVSFVGEVAPILNGNRMATVVAESSCRLMRFGMVELNRIFELDIDLHQNFLAGVICDLSWKVQASNQAIATSKER